ncbi:DNA polymerase [Streptomyces sp. NPDC051677]|uniref:DNA polymerase n=1 Tax=Streptomyces sp. NPDC051677 TaxID=3365669 RepID=UPI0037CF93DD
MVFDTETTADKEQRLNFGAALYLCVGADGKLHPVAEYLIYADDLPERNPDGYAVLQDYVLRGHSHIRGKYAPTEYDKRTFHDHARQGWPEGMTSDDIMGNLPPDLYPPNEFSSVVDTWDVISNDIEREPASDIQLIPQTEFAERMNHAAYPSRSWKANKPATVVGFNLPFDLSRIATGVTRARGKYSGGFTHDMRAGGKSGNIRTAKRGIKGAMFAYTGGKEGTDYFCDASTLAFGLTSESYTLAKAGKAFGAESLKDESEQPYGQITAEHIHYCRKDVHATASLYVKLVEELDKHPIDLTDDKVFSPASIAKKYLDAMGVPKPLEKQPDFPDDIIGYSMATFYGGRAEAHIRKVPAPVSHVDVTSMYPTVNANMRLWDLLTASRIDVREETEEVRKLVKEIEIDDLFDASRWPEFRGIVQVRPTEDLFPVRARFGTAPSETIGISYVTSDEPNWWSLPDVINAKINAGKVPEILRAFRFYPGGEKLSDLKPVKLRGQVPINPAKEDFFRAVIERRLALKNERECECGTCDRCRNVLFLKILANAGSYGIFVEVNREDDKEESEEVIHGNHGSWNAVVRKPETPGQYCFPPIGALITGAARLVLGMLEKLVTDEGGTWVMCDTDSMAIVASHEGGWIAPECVLPPRPVESGYPGAIPVLPYSKVEEIRKRFDALNPYDAGKAGTVEILKRELPKRLEDPQPYCYAISAKRYAEFEIAEDGGIRFPDNKKVKEHGLGQYMNPEDIPTDPRLKEERGTREWVRDIWRYIILKDAGHEVTEPYWFARPVMSKVAVSTWNMYEHLRHWNDGKEYRDQIKPYGFIMAPVVTRLGRAVRGSDFRLIGPFSSNPEEWGTIGFRNMHDPESPEYVIATNVPADVQTIEGFPVVGVDSYADVVSKYSVHPEYKFTDSNGEACGYDTRGLLQRPRVKVSVWEHQGKETNNLEERSTDTIPEREAPVTEYGTGKDDFQRIAVPALKKMYARKGQELADAVQSEGVTVGRQQISRVLNGKAAPRPELRNALISVAVGKALEDFGKEPTDHEWSHRVISRERWRELLTAWQDTH